MAESKPSPNVPAQRPPAAAAKAPPSGKPAASAAAPEPEAKPEGRLAWFVGWVLVPGVLVGGIFGGGAALGAHNPDGWFPRTVMWVASLF